MIFAYITALAMSGGASAPPAAPASNNNSSASVTPIREVVYKVSFTRRLEVSNETYGGSVVNDTQPNPVVYQAPAFDQATGDASDSGTITIDVMQVVGDTLGMRVTESWVGSTPSGTYLGNVSADGSMNFANGQMNECTRAILEYFGTNVMAGQPADTGVAWTRTSDGQTADVTTKYSVGEIEGALATIHEQSTLKTKSVALLDTVATTDVQYKPIDLVPVSGRFVLHASRSSPSSVTNVTTIGNFQRVSDTHDTGP